MTTEQFNNWFDQMALKWIPAATKFWFELMGWLLIIAVLEYARQRSENISIDILFFISAIGIVVFIQVPIDILVTRKLKKVKRITALLVTISLTVWILKILYSATVDLSLFSP